MAIPTVSKPTEQGLMLTSPIRASEKLDKVKLALIKGCRVVSDTDATQTNYILQTISDYVGTDIGGEEWFLTSVSGSFRQVLYLLEHPISDALEAIEEGLIPLKERKHLNPYHRI